MENPVVSKYGKRPLLEVPALHVDSQRKMEITSLQDELSPGKPALLYRPDINALQGSLFAPPPGPLPQHVQPQFVHVPPMRLQHPPHQYIDQTGNLVPAPTFPMQPPPLYPGVHNPYQGPVNQGYYIPPPMQPYPQATSYPQPPTTPQLDNFRLEGVLEYGHLTTVHFRDRTSHFRELPEVLRRELQKTYGQYPFTDIKIISQGGEIHIYATPRNENDYEGEGIASENRLIGFGHVR